jgi:hypothetical protein
MRFLLLLCASVVYASGDILYKCKSPYKSASESYKATKDICNKLGEDTYSCDNWAEDYCGPLGDNINKFKKLCEDHGDDWYWTEC